MTSLPDLHAVILAGGAGTRFWPLSREMAPKQLLTLFGDESLIAGAVGRIERFAGGGVHVLTSEALADELKNHLLSQPSIAGESIEVLAEPLPRNTAFAIALAAARLVAIDPDAVMIVLPSDHILTDDDEWTRCIGAAYDAAKAGKVVTFGLVPTRPETGYGYIKAGAPLAEHQTTCEVSCFVEKPDAETARKYFEGREFLWNSGMFLVKASRVLEELETAGDRALTEDSAGGRKIADAARTIASWGPARWNTEQARDVALSAPAVPFDKAVLEVSDDVAVVPATLNWSDVGSLLALDELAAPDDDGNRLMGRAIDVDSHDVTTFSEGRLVATLGLRDVIVVDTPDATLVAAKERAQDVRQVVDALRAMGAEEAVRSGKSVRPWGTWTLLLDSPGYKVKRIEIAPGKRLSLQSHANRSEHWVVVAGEAHVQRDGESVVVRAGESTYLPAGMVHRLANEGEEPLVVVEIAVGTYLGEDDIVRYEDDWSR